MSDAGAGYVVRISPIIKHIGEQSYTGVIDSYFEAEVNIGNYSSVASPFYVHGATEHPCVFDKNLVSTFPFGDKWQVNYPKTTTKGKIEVGSDVWIGESVTLLSGVKIGDGVLVGARSVVAKDVPPYAIVVGNPARIVRFRFSPEIIEKLLTIRWWNWPKERIEQNIELMKDVQKFVDTFYDK